MCVCVEIVIVVCVCCDVICAKERKLFWGGFFGFFASALVGLLGC